VPKVSTNLMSTILAPAFLAVSNTLFGFAIFILQFFVIFTQSGLRRR
jgi:hypothetical protein